MRAKHLETLGCVMLATLFLAQFIYVFACELMGFCEQGGARLLKRA